MNLYYPNASIGKYGLNFNCPVCDSLQQVPWWCSGDPYHNWGVHCCSNCKVELSVPTPQQFDGFINSIYQTKKT